MSDAVKEATDEQRPASVVEKGIRTARARSSTIRSVPWEYLFVALIIVVVVWSTVLTVSPILPLLAEESDELKQAPRFYVSYTWQAPGEAPAAPNTTQSSNTTSTNDTTPANTTTPANDTAPANNTTPSDDTTPANNTTFTNDTTPTDDAASSASSPDIGQSDQPIVSITVYYRCHSVSKYARTKYRDYRCGFTGEETTVVSNRTGATNTTNETRFDVVWEPKEGQSEPPPQEIDLSAENGEIPTSKREISLESPSESGTYTLRVTAVEGNATLWRPTLQVQKEDIRIPLYDPGRVANFRDREFDRRTLPFQLLAIVVLWFGGIQLALSILNYRRNGKS